jgi:antibiotic biosynthesis monooxygenase (ABM) superfamily enzyme
MYVKLSWVLIDRLMTKPRSQEYEDMRRRWIERSMGVVSIMKGPSFQRGLLKVLNPQGSHNPTWKKAILYFIKNLQFQL